MVSRVSQHSGHRKQKASLCAVLTTAGVCSQVLRAGRPARSPGAASRVSWPPHGSQAAACGTRTLRTRTTQSDDDALNLITFK